MKIAELPIYSPEKYKSSNRSRSERRKEINSLRRKKKKLERKLRHISLDIDFENDNTTAFSNFHLVETFKKSIDFNELIRELFTLEKGSNSSYKANNVLDYLIDSNALGFSRFEHTEVLRFDPGYKDIKGIDRFPSEKVFRDFFSLFNNDHIGELCAINRRLIELRSQWQGVKEIWFDIDSTTITLFGKQEHGEKRYNARYRGRLSFELMVCFINETKDLLYIEICPTGSTPKAEFKNFLSKCKQLVPANYVLKGLRIDKGFFSETNLNYLEGEYLAYVAKVPLYTNIRHYVEKIPENHWKEVNEYTTVTRKKLLLDKWEHDRFIDIRRIKIEQKTGQMLLPDAYCYRYEAIVSSEIENSPESNLNWYDGRGCAEDLIKELKDGFAVDEASQHQLTRNTAYAFVKAISYNLFQFFKSVAMPESHQSWQIQTVRRKIINIPGNILGRGIRNRRVKIAPREYLKLLLPLIQQKLEHFLYFVANNFRHVELKYLLLLS